MKSGVQISILIVVVAMLGTLVGCETTPEDLEKWRNAKNGDKKMMEYLEDKESSIEVKAKALMTLSDMGAGYKCGDALKKLDRSVAEKIVALSSKELLEQFSSKDLDTQVRAKDTCYILYEYADRETKDLFKEKIFLSWLKNRPFIEYQNVGNIKQDMMYQVVGAEAVPLLIAQIDEAPIQQLKPIMDAARRMQLPAANDGLAKKIVSMCDKVYPEIPEVYLWAFKDNNSDEIFPFARKVVLDPDVSNEALYFAQDFILIDWLPKYKAEKVISLYRELIKAKKPGYKRWVAADGLLRMLEKKGFSLLLQDLPTDPDYFGVTGDYTWYGRLASGHSEATFFQDESETFCSRIPQFIKGDFHDLMIEGLSGSWSAKAVCIQCIAQYGSLADIPHLEALLKDKTPVPSWDGKKIMDLAKETIEELQKKEQH